MKNATVPLQSGVYYHIYNRGNNREDLFFETLIFYIHYNPQKHGFVGDFRDWQWSSYHTLISIGNTRLKRDEVLGMFGGLKGFGEFHQGMVDEKKLADLIDDEFEYETSYTSRIDLTGLGDL